MNFYKEEDLEDLYEALVKKYKDLRKIINEYNYPPLWI
jgi:hypothetical protein